MIIRAQRTGKKCREEEKERRNCDISGVCCHPFHPSSFHCSFRLFRPLSPPRDPFRVQRDGIKAPDVGEREKKGEGGGGKRDGGVGPGGGMMYHRGG